MLDWRQISINQIFKVNKHRRPKEKMRRKKKGREETNRHALGLPALANRKQTN